MNLEVIGSSSRYSGTTGRHRCHSSYHFAGDTLRRLAVCQRGEKIVPSVCEWMSMNRHHRQPVCLDYLLCPPAEFRSHLDDFVTYQLHQLYRRRQFRLQLFRRG